MSQPMIYANLYDSTLNLYVDRFFCQTVFFFKSIFANFFIVLRICLKELHQLRLKQPLPLQPEQHE